MSLTKLTLAGKNLILPGQGEFGRWHPGLKVHKIEIFFGFDFEICTISLLVMSKDFTEKKFFGGHYWGSYDFSA
jgi:hypothetical protein